MKPVFSGFKAGFSRFRKTQAQAGESHHKGGGLRGPRRGRGPAPQVAPRPCGAPVYLDGGGVWRRHPGERALRVPGAEGVRRPRSGRLRRRVRCGLRIPIRTGTTGPVCRSRIRISGLRL